MNQHDTPAKVASTDGLGPVACATCGEQPYYTKAHIATAVAAERERCANVLRYWLAGYAPDAMSSYEARCLAQILDGTQAPTRPGPNVGIEPPRSGRLE